MSGDDFDGHRGGGRFGSSSYSQIPSDDAEWCQAEAEMSGLAAPRPHWSPSKRLAAELSMEPRGRPEGEHATDREGRLWGLGAAQRVLTVATGLLAGAATLGGFSLGAAQLRRLVALDASGRLGAGTTEPLPRKKLVVVVPEKPDWKHGWGPSHDRASHKNAHASVSSASTGLAQLTSIPMGNEALWGEVKLRSGLCLQTSCHGEHVQGHRRLSRRWHSFGTDTACRLQNSANVSSAENLVLVRTAQSLASCKIMCRLSTGCVGIEYSANASWCQIWKWPVRGARKERGRECLGLAGGFEEKGGEAASSHTVAWHGGNRRLMSRTLFSPSTPPPPPRASKVSVCMARCDSSEEDQQWFYDAPMKFIRTWSNLCLEVDKLGTDRSHVHAAPCDVNSDRQRWEYNLTNGAIQTWWRNGGVAWCLDTPQGLMSRGEVQMFICFPGDRNQAWNFGDGPWVPASPALASGVTKGLPTACPNHFTLPPPPTKATEHNGIALEDTCFNWTDRHQQANHVFIIGDWGGIFSKSRTPMLQPADHRSRVFNDHHRNFVAGVDDWAQLRVAEQMRKRAAKSHPDYVLNVGDNFYWGGVGSSGDYGQGQGQVCGGMDAQAFAEPGFSKKVASGQWEKIFEEIYWGDGLDGKQWLGVLGNHDYGGFKFTAAWDQAIGYTWVRDSTRRWMTPAQYWSAKVWYPNFSVDYFFVDTNHLDAHFANEDPWHNVCSGEHNPEGAQCASTGPSSIQDCKGWFARLWDDQFGWLERGLSASTAEWQIVVSHFPAISMASNWTYLSRKYGIDLIVSGHTHSQMVVYLEDNFLGETAYIISGGGGGITSEGVPSITGDDDQYGFMDMTLTRQELIIEQVSHGGKLRGTTRVKQRLPRATVL
eukprot:CAMPEP_0115438672 /NCGR_PEP_ID=MMETSP0271-20121206/35378_1 /TAXON_ID=71861 /ORGANISM="Scrippsiella trochoidea, Strain CCMP3099" /LENGTH=878 /DNA_ID=CAMNT_0002864333 /DNA_START=208 /DNA_END=2840 /DNA_ORIENTATION=+